MAMKQANNTITRHIPEEGRHVIYVNEKAKKRLYQYIDALKRRVQLRKEAEKAAEAKLDKASKTC